MKMKQTKVISITALFMAIVFVLTFVARFPIALGYANLGMVAVLLAALILPKSAAIIAGAVGTVISDFILGYAIWCIPTLIIRVVMVLAFILIIGKSFKCPSVKGIFATIIAIAISVAGYTFSGMIISGSVGAGLVAAIGLLIEGVVNAVVFLLLWTVFDKSHIINKARGFLGN